MKFFRFAIISLCSVFILLGCQQATSDSSQSGPVQGTVNSQSFTTAISVATASKTVSNGYDILLSGSSSTPNVYFTVESSPQTYTVTTFGVNGLAVTAYIGDMNFISFDSGSITITKIDISSNQITGTFSTVKTSDGNSSLTGNFTATIQ